MFIEVRHSVTCYNFYEFEKSNHIICLCILSSLPKMSANIFHTCNKLESKGIVWLHSMLMYMYQLFDMNQNISCPEFLMYVMNLGKSFDLLHEDLITRAK